MELISFVYLRVAFGAWFYSILSLALIPGVPMITQMQWSGLAIPFLR